MSFDLKRLFDDIGIEYFSILEYKNCREINPKLRDKLDFSPECVIIFLLPYYVSEAVNLSLYATSRDYHFIVKELGETLVAKLKNEFSDNSFKAYTDHSPIDERHAALRAGLGILGDNGLLINEKYGSYVFIAEIISDILPEKLGLASDFEARQCEHCGLCKANCPTSILSGNGSDCLSAITQKKGILTDEEISFMRKCNTVWGCDSCQKVCPHNAKPKITPIAFFHNDRIEKLTAETVENMSDEEFSKRAFAWRTRKTVMRNLEYLES